MILSLSNQAYMFFISITIGLIIGIFYDFFRLIRKIFLHKNKYVYIEDIIFWLISTFISFYILLHKNNLELRFYLFLGIFLGITIYFVCFSNFVVTITLKIIQIVIKPIVFVLNLFKPYISKVNTVKNKTLYKEKIYLQKLCRYGKISYKNFVYNIKIIKNKI